LARPIDGFIATIGCRLRLALRSPICSAVIVFVGEQGSDFRQGLLLARQGSLSLRGRWVVATDTG